MRGRTIRRSAIVMVAAVALGGTFMACSRTATPAQIADRVSRGIYADDVAAATAPFDDDLKKNVTRAEVGDLSDRMHRLGEYRSLAQTNADVDRGRYDFNLTFDHGTMLAELRVDPSGKVGAFRIVPEGAH